MNETQQADASRQLSALEKNISSSNDASGIIVVAYGGSIAYGLDTESSDIDLRGAFKPSARSVIMGREKEQFEMHNDADAVIYSYRKLVALLKACNPNVIELLGIAPEHVLLSSPEYETLLDNMEAFLSSKCAMTFGGYATQQLRRIKNSLSRDGNGTTDSDGAKRSMDAAITTFNERYPGIGDDWKIKVGIKDASAGANGLTLSMKVNNMPLLEAKGMIRELDDIAKNADNLAARNRKKDTAHLAKHMSHLIRLLRMGSEMLEGKGVNTYRSADRELLLDIKQGKWIIDEPDGTRTVAEEFWDLLNDEEKRFKKAKRETSLPAKPNDEIIDELIYSEYKKILSNN